MYALISCLCVILRRHDNSIKSLYSSLLLCINVISRDGYFCACSLLIGSADKKYRCSLVKRGLVFNFFCKFLYSQNLNHYHEFLDFALITFER